MNDVEATNTTTVGRWALGMLSAALFLGNVGEAAPGAIELLVDTPMQRQRGI